jgi:hypothetical protein
MNADARWGGTYPVRGRRDPAGCWSRTTDRGDIFKAATDNKGLATVSTRLRYGEITLPPVVCSRGIARDVVLRVRKISSLTHMSRAYHTARVRRGDIIHHTYPDI